EHHFFHLLQDGRVDLFLALKQRAQTRDEAASGGREAFAKPCDVAFRRRNRRARRRGERLCRLGGRGGGGGTSGGAGACFALGRGSRRRQPFVAGRHRGP